MTNTTLETMFTALRNPEGSTRRQAALALGASRDDSVVPVLLAQLRVEYDPHVIEDITWALVQHAEAARGDLAQMLTDDDPARRRTAAHVLSKVADPADFDAVVPLVADEDADVAIKAYRAAANTGGARALTALVARLGDGELLQRDALSNAFAAIGAASVAPLTSALTDGSPAAREHAAEALGHLGAPEADPAADALERAAGDDDPTVRLAAVSALGQLGGAADEALGRLAGGADALTAQVATRLLAGRVQA